MTSAMRISQAVTIRATSAAVWQVVSDFAAQPQWMHDATQVRFVTGRTSGTGEGFAARSRLLPEFQDDQPSLKGQVAIVTGATSGTGQAIATELARRGAAVHLLARDAGRAACTGSP